MTKQEIVKRFAELLDANQQFGTEANELIDKYADLEGISEHGDADVELFAEADEWLEEQYDLLDIDRSKGSLPGRG